MSLALTEVVDEAVDRIRSGDRRALARAITWVERGDKLGDELVGRLLATAGTSQVVGITGPPGAGKSTLTSTLVRQLRATGSRVGVVSVDPSSPFGGGALLGDRLRMSEHLGDQDVFIRSMASRGSLGGLSLAAPYAIALVEAWGADRIVLETVGIGQSEIDVADHADAVVLVLNPATGDSIQALKSGVMEIPDVLVVNVRADDATAEDAVRQLKTAVQLGGRRTTAHVLAVNALSGKGITELVAKLADQRSAAASSGSLALAATSRARWLVETSVRVRIAAAFGSAAGRDLVDALVEGRRTDVRSVVDDLMTLASNGPPQEVQTDRSKRGSA